ncbi:MAG: hypothetical protein QNJ97_02450 [Myxococcota bacterium]|nr:hypothetical protein [Myxococcota bacterium]
MRAMTVSFLLVLCAWGCDSSGDSGTDSGVDTESSGGDSDVDTSSESDAGEDRFSFFYTSMSAMQARCGQDGCGGDLGGLAGADEICRSIAQSVSGSTRTWRAFLSATTGADGNPVNAIDRIGTGPWYDINGRLIAENIDGLMNDRPNGDPQAVQDLPDETGQGTKNTGDFHDAITGSNAQGMLFSTDPGATCWDWTSTDPSPPPEGVEIIVGHSWPASSGQHWIQAHRVPDCSPSISDGQSQEGTGVGALGGYGGIYCFAL